MTKKVLISLKDVEYMSKCLLNRYGNDVSDWMERWFDDQEDIHDMISDAVNDGLEKATESFIQAAMLKANNWGKR